MTGWVPHFSVESIEQATTAAKELGAVILQGPGGPDTAYIRTPDGVLTGITAEPGDPAVEHNHGADYSAIDVEAATGFAEAVLGVTRLEVVDDPYSMRLLMRGRHLAGGVFHLYGLSGFSARSSWIVYLGVKDVATHVARAAESGSRVLVPPTASPFNLYSVLVDPWGTVFGFAEFSNHVDSSSVAVRDASGVVLPISAVADL